MLERNSADFWSELKKQTGGCCFPWRGKCLSQMSFEV